jgi:inner membrane protein
MIIGHLPAGYVISRLLFPRFESSGVAYKRMLWAGMLGAVAPDFDMLYFHLADHRQHHHHTYISHFPVMWAGLLLMSAIWLYASRVKWPAALAVIFSLNGFIHMVLDSIVGDIWWFAPWVDQRYSFFTVPALHKPAWLNFILHWSFALEIGIVVWAAYLWRRNLDPAINKGNPPVAPV